MLTSELPDGITFFISGLLHALQVTEDMSEEDKILSNFFPHLSQEKRYIGIVLIFYLNYFLVPYRFFLVFLQEKICLKVLILAYFPFTGVKITTDQFNHHTK